MRHQINTEITYIKWFVPILLLIIYLMVVSLPEITQTANLLKKEGTKSFEVEEKPSNSVYSYILNVSRILHKTNERFVSFSIDSAEIRKDENVSLIRNLQLKRIVSYLSPGYLRVGGTEADRLLFKQDNAVGSSLDPNNTFFMTGRTWMQISKFAQKTGFKILFDLNVLLRKGLLWDSSNSKELLDFSADQLMDVDWQLGNAQSFGGKFNVTVSPAQLAADFSSLRRLLDSYPLYRTAQLVGPDVTSPHPPLHHSFNIPAQLFLHKFAAERGADVVNSFAWHHYYLHSDSELSDFLSPAVFDSLKTAIDMIKLSVSPRTKPLWITESGSASGGGVASISDSFVASFLYIDCLGLAAREGIGVVVRQSLYSKNYALIDRDTLTPNPDYWVSYIYKRLVTQSVLSIQPADTHAHPATLRLYAHCSFNNSIVVFGSNFGNATTQLLIETGVKSSASKAKLYQLTALTLLSKEVLLNGRPLVMPKSGVPRLPASVVDMRTPLHISPHSIFFLHLNHLHTGYC